MIAVPFIYFSLIALWQYRRNNNRLDIGCFIALIYGISGLFSILMEIYGLNTRKYEITPLACIVYCGLLTLNLFPFLKYSNLSITKITPTNNEQILKGLAWIVLCWATISLIFSFDFILRVLNGDMAAIRNSIYQGKDEQSWMQHIPGPIRTVLAILNMCLGCSWILLLFAFFSLYTQKLPLKYFIFFFIGSLMGPINGIIGADRSASAYWIISLFAVYLLFSHIIPKKQKKYIKIFMLSIVGILAIYLSAMTTSRFDRYGTSYDELSGSQSSIISYLGQSYPNFCYFFDEFEPAFTNLNLIFPFTAKYICGEELVGGVPLQEEMSKQTGIFTGVFYTYLGQIMIFCGVFVLFLYCITYTLLSLNKLRNIKKANISNLFNYYVLASIMQLGPFVFFYARPTLTFSVIFFLFMISNFFSNKKRPNIL